MKIFQESISIETEKLYDFINITEMIEKIVKKSKVQNGMVFVNSLHNTAAIIIQEDDSSIHRDLIRTMEKLFPLKEKYEHDYEGNINATAHLKSNFLGNAISIPLKDNKLVLGTWQKVFFVELFEPRNRKVVVTIIGEHTQS